MRNTTLKNAYSPKRAAVDRILKQLRIELLEEVGPFCEDCGKPAGTVRLEVSHRISKALNFDYIAVRENLDLLCRLCHLKHEAGYWPLMKKGKEIAEYIAIEKHDFYMSTMFKARPNMLYEGSYLMSEEEIETKLIKLNPKFKVIGWEELTLEYLVDSKAIQLNGSRYKKAS